MVGIETSESKLLTLETIPSLAVSVDNGAESQALSSVTHLKDTQNLAHTACYRAKAGLEFLILQSSPPEC